MQVTLNIPDDIAESLRDAYGPDLSRAALERFALDAYNSERLTQYEVQKLLAFKGRFETENWLIRVGARVHYTQEDFEIDGQTIRELSPR